MLNLLNSNKIIQQSEEKYSRFLYLQLDRVAFAYTAALVSLPFQPLHIFTIHFFYCLSLSTTPLHGFFESVFLVRRSERRVSWGLSFLRTGPANMVYSCPETVSDMYVNQGGRLQKGGRTREKGERGREWEREHEGRSLQKCQAASRQLKWGQGEERKGGNKKKKKTLWVCWIISAASWETFCLHSWGTKQIFTYILSQKVYFHLSLQVVLTPYVHHKAR